MVSPFRINPDVAPSDNDPHSWLPLIGHPPGEVGPGGIKVMWGVLRPTFGGYRPSLARFAVAKLMVAAPPDTSPWTVTAHRHEVLLPAHAGDHLLDPRNLIELAERSQLADAKAQAAYITLTSAPVALHAQYEVARLLGRWLVERFDIAVLLVQHVPARSGGSAAPHVHMIIPGPRVLTPYSLFGRPVAELARDKGRELVLERLATIVGADG